MVERIYKSETGYRAAVGVGVGNRWAIFLLSDASVVFFHVVNTTKNLIKTVGPLIMADKI